jgi:hypothetical protein
MHLKKVLRRWFIEELAPAILKYGIEKGDCNRISNIDKKGACIYMLAGETVVIPVRIKEIYTGIPENCISVTIIKCI